MELRRFQRAFIRGATAPGIDTAALSVPRGNGKSWLAARLLSRMLDAGGRSIPAGHGVGPLWPGPWNKPGSYFRFLRSDARGSGRLLVHGLG